MKKKNNKKQLKDILPMLFQITRNLRNLKYTPVNEISCQDSLKNLQERMASYIKAFLTNHTAWFLALACLAVEHSCNEARSAFESNSFDWNSDMESSLIFCMDSLELNSYSSIFLTMGTKTIIFLYHFAHFHASYMN